MSQKALTGLMLGCLAVGMAVMLVLDSPVARVVGVVALFAFIVTGVFLIADPEFLAAEDDEERVGSRRA